MTIEEAVLALKRYQGYEPMEDGNILKHSFDLTDETVDTLLSAMRTELSGETLTLEQLREMDGKPAYWPEDKSWGIISVDKTGRWSGIPFFRGRWQGVNFEYNIEARGMEVYAYPPDHIDREALGCPYCTPDADGYVRKFGAFSIHDGMLETGHCKPQEIKYCPHCSRQLTEEAWAELENRMGVRV